MCLVLKLDNGKVVSIGNEQTESQTESCQHPVPYYNIDTRLLKKTTADAVAVVKQAGG